MLLALLGILPWVGLAFFMAYAIREPRTLSPVDLDSPESSVREGWPLVSVIVPARNEARNIERCVESLVRSNYPNFEVIVVDDRSTDGTAERARAVGRGRAQALEVMEGTPLPAGWFGKPWACQQGAEAARGRLFLFTDADTVHGPDLLAQVVRARSEDEARVVSLVGRQEMGTFWEKLLQPQIFILIGLRFRVLDRVFHSARWQNAIANGQFILVDREAYWAIGGHGRVREEVVEDLRLAQEWVRSGHPLSVRLAEAGLSTRMYASLREILAGWTKNVAVGARQASGVWAPLALPGILLFLAVFWILPGIALVWALVDLLGGGRLPPSILVWAGSTWSTSTGIWWAGYARFQAPRRLAWIHPLGALGVMVIVFRSWVRGARRIEWKGRRYGRGGEVRA
jgi:chlorobactene glucosyltransferase